jgi:large subunit ribosomal protein L15
MFSLGLRSLLIRRLPVLQPLVSAKTFLSSKATVSSPSAFLTASTAVYGLKKKKRVGRGKAGKGKTAGRGMKGFKARQRRATPTPGFEGGQSGIIKALPKIGLQRKV